MTPPNRETSVNFEEARMKPVQLVTILTIFALGCSDSPSDSNSSPEPMDAGHEMVGDMEKTHDATVDSGPAADAGNGCGFEPGPAESYEDPQTYTPKWAFMPWISKDISDRDDTYRFVDGFIDRDIPVGVVVLDSPWETNYNTFVPNPDRYPRFEEMVDDMADREVKVVLWLTQMVNNQSADLEFGGDVYDGPSPNFEEGFACDYYVEEGETYFWWKGFGAGIDFFNPDAMQWWHRQQDALLEMGVAGWKLDFGESYIEADPMQTAAGPKSLQEYSEAYYQDFYAYGAAKVGTENFVTMVRGYDESYGFEGRFFARPEHAPVVWMGDNRRDWVGLVDSLDHMFRSAEAGYVVVGSDLGGYLDRDDRDLSEPVPFDQENFVRWIAVSALSPFMQLHGRANLEPWSIDVKPDETVDIYRYWAKIHTALVPFWYSLAQEAYLNGAEPIVRPVGDGPQEWADDWRYMLGEALLVAPLLDGTGTRDVDLPAGSWRDWWQPDVTIAGGQTLTADATDQQRIPLYIREGAIVPIEPVDGTIPFLGSESQAGMRTLLVWPSQDSNQFVWHHDVGSTTEIELAARELSLNAFDENIWVAVHISEPERIMVNGNEVTIASSMAELATLPNGWFYDPQLTRAWVKLEPAQAASVTW